MSNSLFSLLFYAKILQGAIFCDVMRFGLFESPASLVSPVGCGGFRLFLVRRLWLFLVGFTFFWLVLGNSLPFRARLRVSFMREGKAQLRMLARRC